jgi:hypothetical protein
MLKVRIDGARVHVEMRNKQEGSVLQGTVTARCLGVQTRLELDSQGPEERIREVVRLAEAGCFTMQALLHEVAVETAVTLNGTPL